MRWLFVLALVFASLIVGAGIERADEAYDALAPERVVAALPGVGAGWLDTLRRVAGAATVDTVSLAMRYDDESLLGVFEEWHHIVNIRTDLRAYFAFQRNVCGRHSFGYEHPVSL